MEEQNKPPRMLEFLFGETAGAAQRGASIRLMLWSEAFDAWLEERRCNYKPNVTKQALLTWRRLLRERQKMPWELEQGDIQQHMAWMQAQGYAASTITNALGIVSNFYQWCAARGMDPECEAGYNPTAEVSRPKVGRYVAADGRPSRLLSRKEVEALLEVLRQDPSLLGKRDYAFVLARLRLGAPLSELQRLQWGQIEQGKGGKRVRWRAGEGSVALPEEVWEAVRDYLAASGRLKGMRAGDYIFAPLRFPGKDAENDQAGAWAEGRYLSARQLRISLKMYGRAAGIPDDRLTLQALHRTAIRLRLDGDSGDGASDDAVLGDAPSPDGPSPDGPSPEAPSLEEMQSFLDCQGEKRFMNYRLRRLPELPQDEGRPGGEEAAVDGAQHIPPHRKPRPFRPGEGMKHGLYALSQPPEKVLAVLAEDIQGVEQEIVGLRTLARGLLELQGEAHSGVEAARLGDAYTMAATRLAAMIESEERLAKLAEREEADDFSNRALEMYDNMAKEMGYEPASEAIRAEVLGSNSELAATDRRLVEEIAGARYVLRNTLDLAGQALERGDIQEYTQLAGVYGHGCGRLMRLLRANPGGQDKLKAFLSNQILAALHDVQEEFGLLPEE